LFDASDVPVSYVKTDQDGKYGFSNLALGTYKIYCDILNIPATPIYVTIDSDDPSSENNQIEVNSTGVGAPVGIETSSLSDRSSWEIYPNPCQDKLNITLGSTFVDNVTIRMYRITGNILFEDSMIKLEKSTLSYDLHAYVAGIYFIQLKSNDQTSTKKLIVQ
jgi:hypothetical protein